MINHTVSTDSAKVVFNLCEAYALSDVIPVEYRDFCKKELENNGLDFLACNDFVNLTNIFIKRSSGNFCAFCEAVYEFGYLVTNKEEEV